MAKAEKAERPTRQIFRATPPDGDLPDSALKEYTRIRVGIKTTAAGKGQPDVTCEVLTSAEVDDATLAGIGELVGKALGVATLLTRRWEQQLASGIALATPLVTAEEIDGWLIQGMSQETDQAADE